MIFLISGLAIVALVMFDFIWTTLSVKGAGPLSSFCSRYLWAVFGAVARRLDRRWPVLIAGPVVLLSALLGWMFLLWLGWTLVFLASADALVTSPDHLPTGFWARVYFVGFTLTTLGIGDIIPDGALWRVLTAASALNGLTVVTMAITYLLGVLSAVTALRGSAVYISALGTSPSGVLLTGWDGSRFEPLADHLMALTPSLHQLSQSMLAYPVLTMFGAERVAAIAPAAVVLDESLTMLEQGVAPDARLAQGRIRPLRNAIDNLIDDMGADLPRAAAPPPVAPSLAALRTAGVPVVDDHAFEHALALQADRRRRLDAMLQHQAWNWRSVAAQSTNHA